MAEVTRFAWEPASADYYRNRIKSLEEQLENAQEQCALKDAYIHDLEKEKIGHIEFIQHLKEKLLEEVLR